MFRHPAVRKAAGGGGTLEEQCSYSANAIYGTVTVGGIIQRHDTVALNSSGQIVSYVQTYAGSRSQLKNVYTWTGNEIRKTVEEDENGNPLVTMDYNWTGGNVASMVQATLSYSSDSTGKITQISETGGTSPQAVIDLWSCN